MANQIAAFFAANGDPEEAAKSSADHLRKFWEPRMRSQIIAHLKNNGGEGLAPVARAAVELLAAEETSGRTQTA